MASINGITIRNLKKFTGHEGESLYQGNIYLNNKKLGFWSQDFSGGCDNYEFDYHLLDEAVEKFRMSELVEDKYKDITCADTLLARLLNLIDDEKMYNKARRDGYTSIVTCTDDYQVFTYYTTRNNADEIIADEYHEKFLARCKEHSFLDDPNFKIKIYTNPKDFTVNL